MKNNLDEDFCYYSGLPSPMAYQKDKSKITKNMQNITNSELSIYQNILNEKAFEKLKILFIILYKDSSCIPFCFIRRSDNQR